MRPRRPPLAALRSPPSALRSGACVGARIGIDGCVGACGGRYYQGPPWPFANKTKLPQPALAPPQPKHAAAAGSGGMDLHAAGIAAMVTLAAIVLVVLAAALMVTTVRRLTAQSSTDGHVALNEFAQSPRLTSTRPRF